MPKRSSKAFRSIMAGLKEMKDHIETGVLAPGARLTVPPSERFPHQITVQWSAEDGVYVARVAAVNAAAHGDTPDAALREVLIAAGAMSEVPKNAAAVALGRAGGLKGGAARAASMTKKARSEIAKKAAKARWKDRQAP